jgi:hypothetical protein
VRGLPAPRELAEGGDEAVEAIGSDAGTRSFCTGGEVIVAAARQTERSRELVEEVS